MPRPPSRASCHSSSAAFAAPAALPEGEPRCLREKPDDARNPFRAAMTPAWTHATLTDRARSSITALFSDTGRPVRDAGDSILACPRLSSHPGSDGICGQRDNDWHGRVEPRRRPAQSEDRPKAWGYLMTFTGLRVARALCMAGFHPDPRLSRRAFYGRGGGRRLRLPISLETSPSCGARTGSLRPLRRSHISRLRFRDGILLDANLAEVSGIKGHGQHTADLPEA